MALLSDVPSVQTPVTSSPVVAGFLSNLPAYRIGVSPLLRGVEIGLVHGFLVTGQPGPPLPCSGFACSLIRSLEITLVNFEVTLQSQWSQLHGALGLPLAEDAGRGMS